MTGIREGLAGLPRTSGNRGVSCIGPPIGQAGLAVGWRIGVGAEGRAQRGGVERRLLQGCGGRE